MLPFVLGQAVAFGLHKSLNWGLCLWGFAGIFLVLVAVELFNEYFERVL
jgi:1,4-dihydroxy-2-naphthoate octaprenyltransferase